MKPLFAALTLFTAVSAQAQAVHKCVANGQVTYQTTACAAGSQGTVVEGAKSAPAVRPGEPPAARDVERCRAAMTVFLKDPESARVEPGASNLGTQTYQGREVRVVSFWINAKNSYGGYTGKAPYACYLDAGGVVDFRELGSRG